MPLIVQAVKRVSDYDAEKLWQVTMPQQDGAECCVKRFFINRHKLSLFVPAHLDKPLAGCCRAKSR
jgi:hypothetical protein